ncbi:MAG: hypothetical protein HYS17_03535 [Micavibrio aeruginosavorus]|uniref:Uncharacterized protein n=1 Tax=Micavibrio aeruginosavorus TaxID=349221 RepID=A0A7T5R3H2_9BACT|nr:MAG: hypothetical protein HYS17_03535 [Micavibrio aeruginosavorus]
MSNVITIQGTTYTINNIADAKTAMAAAQNSTDVIGVLTIANDPAYVTDGTFTVSELTTKANSLSTTIAGADTVVLYSGDLDLNGSGGLPTYQIANQIAADSNGAVAILDNTEAGKVTFDPEFTVALNNAIAEYLKKIY